MRARMLLTVERDKSAMEALAFNLDGVGAWPSMGHQLFNASTLG